MNRARIFGKSFTLLAAFALLSLGLAGCAATVGTDEPAQSNSADLVVTAPAPSSGDPAPDPNVKTNPGANPADGVQPGDDNSEPRPNPWTGDVPGDDNGEPRPNPWNPRGTSAPTQAATK
jgi:hypothetical protein